MSFTAYISTELQARLEAHLRAEFCRRFETYYHQTDAETVADEALTLAQDLAAECGLALFEAGQRLLAALDGQGWALWPFLDIDNLIWDDGACEWTVRGACRRGDMATKWAAILHADLWRRRGLR